MERERKEKVNVKETKEYQDWLKARQTFDKEDKGILHPIRAIVRTYRQNKSFLGDIFDDSMNCQSIMDDIANDSSTMFYNPIQHFVSKSVIVGYWSTRKIVLKNEDGNELGAIGFGYSFCRPSDYPDYKKHIGQLNAIPARVFFSDMDEAGIMAASGPYSFYQDIDSLAGKENSKYTLEATFKNGKAYIGAYYWPISISDQFKEFIKRCVRYYKANN